MKELMEDKSIRPLLQNAIIKHKTNEFRVDRWFNGDNHYYTFICITDNSINEFSKKPSEVVKLIKNKTITVLKYGYEKFWI